MTKAEQLLNLIPPSEIKNIMPSEWVESRISLPSNLSPLPGKFKYERAPYCREWVDFLSPDNPDRMLALMAGSQIGKSIGFVLPGICYLIENHPGNIIFTAGRDDLLKKAIEQKLDVLIDASGIAPLIGSNSRRSRRKADGTYLKEFRGGAFHAASIQNDEWVRQETYKYGFLDDFEMARLGNDNREGDILNLIIERFKWYINRGMKLSMISTPALKEGSKIEPIYLKGDQRKYMMPCPHCGEMIEYVFYKRNEDGDRYGVIFERDSRGHIIKGSTGYVCKHCGSFFLEKHKKEMLINGIWTPTAERKMSDLRSYHLNGLYAPPGTETWEDIATKFLNCHGEDGKIIPKELQVFKNLILGETFKGDSRKIKGNKIMENTRPYAIGVIPKSLSKLDGNGNIVLITCACDLGGTEDDARLDYEILAHSQNGSTYSIEHGSLGKPRNFSGRDKEQMSYKLNDANSVWKIFTQRWQRKFKTDEGGEMSVMIVGVDSGYMENYASSYCDKHPGRVVLMKGADDTKEVREDLNSPFFKKGLKRSDLYLPMGNLIKDMIFNEMSLPVTDIEKQEAGSMNFPHPEGGLYTYDSYFKEYEGEERVATMSGSGTGSVKYLWTRKYNGVRNHYFDCRVYNIALRYIFARRFFDLIKGSSGSTWEDYCKAFGAK